MNMKMKYIALSMLLLMHVLIASQTLENIQNVTVTLDRRLNEVYLEGKELRDITGISTFEVLYNGNKVRISEIDNLSLNLARNQLDVLPSEIGNLTNLVKLNLLSNNLTVLPDSLGNLSNLTELNLSYNKLKELPQETWKLTNLKNLSLSGNRLISLSPEIGNLSSLNELDLSRNSLTHLPAELWTLTNLTKFYLSHSPLEQLPPEIGSLTNLTRLDLSQNKFTFLPPEIGNLRNMLWLSIKESALTSLPEEIGSLTNLEKLDLSNNQLTGLPHSIGNLINLRQLDIHYNQLATLPEEIGDLASLAWLNLSNNKLTLLPRKIGNLQKLTRLDLSRNQLTEIPDSMETLDSLNELNISTNKLTEITPIPNLVSLTVDQDLTNKIDELWAQNKLVFLRLQKLNQSTVAHPVYKESLAQWVPEMAPIIYKEINDIGYNYLYLSNKGLTDLTHLSDLMVYDWTEKDDAGQIKPSIKPITDIQNLYINLSNNRLVNLPPELQYINNLVGLDLSGNKILRDITALVELPLQHLNLSYCNNISAEQLLKVLASKTADNMPLIGHLRRLTLYGFIFTEDQLKELITLLDQEAKELIYMYHSVNDATFKKVVENITKRNKSLYDYSKGK